MADTTQQSNRGLITLMIIIGIVIIILLARPIAAGRYSYNSNFLTASTVPIGYNNPNIVYTNTPSFPTVEIQKSYGHPITVYQDYPQTTYQYTTSYPTTNYYPEGCTAYTTYSATTGWPCR